MADLLLKHVCKTKNVLLFFCQVNYYWLWTTNSEPVNNNNNNLCLPGQTTDKSEAQEMNQDDDNQVLDANKVVHT